MSYLRKFGLTALAMVAFASNSLLCRQALAHTQFDAASFTLVRLLAGAVALCLIVRVRDGALSAVGWAAKPTTMPARITILGFVAQPTALGLFTTGGRISTTGVGGFTLGGGSG